MKNAATKTAIGTAIFVAAVGVICILVCLVSFNAKADMDSIPQLTELHSEYDTEEVVGSTRQQLTQRWGEPDGILSGFFGDIWITDSGDEIIAYYDSDETVLEVKYIHSMKATVMEANGTTLLLEPFAGEDELNSADRITVGYSALELSEDITAKFVAGAKVQVGYDGSIAETYPAQITAYDIRLIEE